MMNLKQEMDAAETVSRVVDRIKRHGRFAEFELSNGIVLKIKPVPPLLLQAVNNEFETPPPPKIFLEDRGREEENPNDPSYIKLLEKLEEEQNLAIQDLTFAAGTEVKYVPEDFYPPDSDEWIKTVEFAGKVSGKPITVEKDDPVKRYICWLRFYALETQSDIAFAQSLPAMLVGIQEGEVEEVIESFRGLPSRGTDTELPTETGSQNGHTDNRATRRARS